MIAVTMAEWIASLSGALSGIAAAHLFGDENQGRTTLCILVMAGIAERMFRQSRPGLQIWMFLKGSAIFLLTLVVLLACIGRLDLRTAQALAGWYGQQRLGSSVGLLIFHRAFVPLPFFAGAWHGHRTHTSEVPNGAGGPGSED